MVKVKRSVLQASQKKALGLADKSKPNKTLKVPELSFMSLEQNGLHNEPINPLEKFERVLQVIHGSDSMLTKNRKSCEKFKTHPIYLLIKKKLR